MIQERFTFLSSDAIIVYVESLRICTGTHCSSYKVLYSFTFQLNVLHNTMRVEFITVGFVGYRRIQRRIGVLHFFVHMLTEFIYLRFLVAVVMCWSHVKPSTLLRTNSTVILLLKVFHPNLVSQYGELWWEWTAKKYKKCIIGSYFFVSEKIVKKIDNVDF